MEYAMGFEEDFACIDFLLSKRGYHKMSGAFSDAKKLEIRKRGYHEKLVWILSRTKTTLLKKEKKWNPQYFLFFFPCYNS